MFGSLHSIRTLVNVFWAAADFEASLPRASPWHAVLHVWPGRFRVFICPRVSAPLSAEVKRQIVPPHLLSGPHRASIGAVVNNHKRKKPMDAAVLAEIEDPRRMKVGALRTKYREVFRGRIPIVEQAVSFSPHRLASNRRESKVISASAHAGERGRSLTTRTCESARKRVSSRNPLTPPQYRLMVEDR
jgi:hypothetical protein